MSILTLPNGRGYEHTLLHNDLELMISFGLNEWAPIHVRVKEASTLFLFIYLFFWVENYAKLETQIIKNNTFSPLHSLLLRCHLLEKPKIVEKRLSIR